MPDLTFARVHALAQAAVQPSIDTQATSSQLSMLALALLVRDHYPSAVTFTLMSSDQGDWYTFGYAYDAAGEELDEEPDAEDLAYELTMCLYWSNAADWAVGAVEFNNRQGHGTFTIAEVIEALTSVVDEIPPTLTSEDLHLISVGLEAGASACGSAEPALAEQYRAVLAKIERMQAMTQDNPTS